MTLIWKLKRIFQNVEKVLEQDITALIPAQNGKLAIGHAELGSLIKSIYGYFIMSNYAVLEVSWNPSVSPDLAEQFVWMEKYDANIYN